MSVKWQLLKPDHNQFLFKRGLNQRMLADQLGIKHQYISMYVNGKSVPSTVRDKLDNYFHNNGEFYIMLYLYKQGIGGQGVFWIGDNLTEGKKQADIAASKDRDDYHDWNLCEYTPPNDDTEYEYTQEHKIIYTGKRGV